MEHENRRHRDHGDYSLAASRSHSGERAILAHTQLFRAPHTRKLTPGPPTSLARLEHGTL